MRYGWGEQNAQSKMKSTLFDFASKFEWKMKIKIKLKKKTPFNACSLKLNFFECSAHNKNNCNKNFIFCLVYIDCKLQFVEFFLLSAFTMPNSAFFILNSYLLQFSFFQRRRQFSMADVVVIFFPFD